jgi:hypothetical protein
MPVIPEELRSQVEPVSLDWRQIDLAPGHVAMDALYRADHETYELTIVAAEHDFDALQREAEGMRVWIHPVKRLPGLAPRPAVPPLPELLEMIAARGAGPNVAVEIAYRPRPFVFRIDPEILANESQTVSGTGDIDVSVSRGRVEVSGLAMQPPDVEVGPAQTDVPTRGYIGVLGLQDSTYVVDGRSSRWVVDDV